MLISTIAELAAAIDRLPSDEPADHPGKSFRTQKEHWLTWLAGYREPGPYGRRPDAGDSARDVYNRIGEPLMLVWLIEASGIDTVLAGEVRRIGHADPSTARASGTMRQQAGMIRRLVPWESVAQRLGLFHQGSSDTYETEGSV